MKSCNTQHVLYSETDVSRSDLLGKKMTLIQINGHRPNGDAVQPPSTLLKPLEFKAALILFQLHPSHDFTVQFV